MNIEESPGEVIRMDPNDGPWYIRDHLSAADAIQAVKDWHEDELGDDAPELGPCQHHWGRWYPARADDGHDHDCTWHHRATAAPGWSPVTVVWEASDWQAREESRAAEHSMRAEVRRRWPTAEIESCAAWHWKCRAQSWVRLRWPMEQIRATLRPWDRWQGYVEPLSWRLPRVALCERAARLGLL